MTDTQVTFQHVGGQPPRPMDFWPSLVVKKAVLDEQIQRLLDADRPADGRRAASIIHPRSRAPGLGFTPGIDVLINVLKPGEKTAPVRRNSNLIGFGLAGRATAVVAAREIRFETWDTFNIPSMDVHQYRNDGAEPAVWFTYSNAPLLEKLEVHYFEVDPPAISPDSESVEKMEAIKRAREVADNFVISEDGARLMGYEYLIDIDVVESRPLIWPWKIVSAHLGKVENIGKEYVGRRLYLLYNPATERRNGTSHSFFATIAQYPPHQVDIPHRHASAAINYYFRGSGRSAVQGDTLHWEAGDLHFSAPSWAVHNHASKGAGMNALTIQDHPLHIAMESLIWQETLKAPVLKLGGETGYQTNLAQFVAAR